MRHTASVFFALVVGTSFVSSAFAAALSEPDTRFLQEAAVASVFEMEASQIALQSATQEPLKEFARLLLIDHERIDANLKSLAKTSNVTLPTEVEGDKLEKLNALQQVSGPEFDKKFIEYVAVGASQESMDRFTQASQGSSSEEIKAFASGSAKLIKQHLDHANNIAKNQAP